MSNYADFDTAIERARIAKSVFPLDVRMLSTKRYDWSKAKKQKVSVESRIRVASGKLMLNGYPYQSGSKDIEIKFEHPEQVSAMIHQLEKIKRYLETGNPQ